MVLNLKMFMVLPTLTVCNYLGVGGGSATLFLKPNPKNWPGAAPTDFLHHLLRSSFLAKPVN